MQDYNKNQLDHCNSKVSPTKLLTSQTPTKPQAKPPLLPTPTSLVFYNNNNSRPQPTRNYRFMSARVRAEKIAKGLSYFRDKPYDQGHKCGFKEPQLFTVEVLGELDESTEDDRPVEDLEGSLAACISVQALSGTK